MLTKERAEILNNYLSADAAKAEALLNLEPEEALAQINAAGFDYTIEELMDFAKALKLAKADGELDVEDLDDVAGGLGLPGACLCVGGGILLGIACNAKW